MLIITNLLRGVGHALSTLLTLFICMMVIFATTYNFIGGYALVLIALFALIVVHQLMRYGVRCNTEEELKRRYPLASSVTAREFLSAADLFFKLVFAFIVILTQFYVVPMYIGNEQLLASNYGLTLESLALLRSIPAPIALEAYMLVGDNVNIKMLTVCRSAWVIGIVVSTVFSVLNSNCRRCNMNRKVMSNADNKVS